jgi:uncharacterized cupin superfamily protein
MQTPTPLHLATTHLRLRPDGRAERLPVTDQFWPDLIAGKYGEFRNEYLVSTSSFDSNWTSWEQHPHGDEIVVLLNGAVDFILETPDGPRTLELRAPGDYAFVLKGTWHTANVEQLATMLFITAGEGTQHRPREQ